LKLDIDLWLWSLDQSNNEAAYSHLLSDDERGRADRFVRPRDRNRFIVGRGRVREILADYAGLAPDALLFSYGPQGKPVLRGGPVFNLSHSDGWAALAVAPHARDGNFQLGVDIEAHRPVEDGVASRFFSDREYAALCALPTDDWMAGFLRCWSRKEAVIKAAGTGLSTPLDSFDVSLTPGELARIEQVSGDLAPVEAWSLVHLDLAPGFVGAVAAVTHGEGFRLCIKQGSFPLN